jgi:hypothetical protein
MVVQPERVCEAQPIAESARAKKSQPRSNRLDATRAGWLRQQALRMQRALLSGINGSRKGSAKS